MYIKALLSCALFAWAVYVRAQEYRVLDFGAVGDGVTNDTVAIRAALQAANNSNGGRVILDANYTFLTAPLDIAQNVILDIRGEIQGSSLWDDYPALPQDPWFNPGWGNVQAHPLILAYNVTNVTITGGGKINGVAENWNWNTSVGPFTLKLIYTNDSTVENITLYNCPRWTFNLGYTNNIHINHVNISNELSPYMEADGTGISNDGFDLTCSTNVLLENSFYKGGDSAVTLQSGGPYACQQSENITVRNFTVWNGGSIGAGIDYFYAKNITFDNMTLIDMECGISVTANGGFVDGITFSNIRMINVNMTAVIFGNYSHINNVRLENITNDQSNITANYRNQNNWYLQGSNYTLKNIQILNSRAGGVNYGTCANVTGVCENVFPYCPCLGLAPSPTWEYYNETESFYTFVVQNMAFGDAEDYCVQNGGHLVSIHSDNEINHILDIFNKKVDEYSSNYILPNFWIGFTSTDNQTFEWTDQSEVDYHRWAPGSPTFSFHPCVYMNNGDSTDWAHFTNWDDCFDCSGTTLPFICKQSFQQQACGSTTESTVATTTTPVTWDYNEQTDSYYLYVTDMKTFDDAESNCVQLGGHLTSILSADEDDFLDQLVLTSPGEQPKFAYFWIGYSNESQQIWQWTDGSAKNYFNWAPGAPGWTNNPCAFYRISDNQTYYLPAWDNYYPCSEYYPSVCKKPANSNSQ